MSEKCHVEPIEKPLDQKALKSATVAYLAVEGIGCPNCATRVSNSLLRVEGVLFCSFHDSLEATAVAYDTQQVTVPDLLEAVSAAGDGGHHHYQASLITQKPAVDVVLTK